MKTYTVENGFLHLDKKSLLCPYMGAGSTCGDWCPQFALQDHQSVIGPMKQEVKLYCTGRTIVLGGGQ